MTRKKQIAPTRATLTNEELERLTLDEILRLKMTDDELTRFRKINEVRRLEIKERSARLRIEQEPILAELRSVGWNVESVWDLVNTATRYPEVVPILLKHLLRPYSDRTREGIARALAVPEPAVQQAWPILAEQYRNAPMGRGIIAPGDTKEFELGAKDGLACALSASVTDETLPQLIALAKDRSQGSSRLLLLTALKKLRKKNSMAMQAIEELASDPELAKEIASWRR